MLFEAVAAASVGYYIPVTVLIAIAAVGTASVMMFRRRGQKRNRFDDVNGVDLSGKTAIVTGANTGIGFWTAQDLAARHCRVILACRSLQRGNEAREKIVAATGNTDIHVRHLDLLDFSSVRQFAQQIVESESHLDILVNNAGVVFGDKGGDAIKHEDGLDVTIATNHLGPYLLTRLLIGLLRSSAPSRIISVSSCAHRMVKGKFSFDGMLGKKKKLDPFPAYCHSKLANILFTRSLAQKLKHSGVGAYCLHPGVISTEIFRHNSLWNRVFARLFFFFVFSVFSYKEPQEGAQTTIYTCVAPSNDLETGKYYMDCDLAEDKVNPLADDLDLAQRLWEVSAQLTGISPEMNQ